MTIKVKKKSIQDHYGWVAPPSTDLETEIDWLLFPTPHIQMKAHTDQTNPRQFTGYYSALPSFFSSLKKRPVNDCYEYA